MSRAAELQSVITPAQRRMLVLPPLVPLAVVLVMEGAEWAGHTWNVHGDFIGMVLLFLVSVVVAVVIEFIALFKVLPALARSPEERTTKNILCASVGAAFVLFIAGTILWLVLTEGRS